MRDKSGKTSLKQLKNIALHEILDNGCTADFDKNKKENVRRLLSQITACQLRVNQFDKETQYAT